MIEYKGRYIVNMRTYKIHDTCNTKKGCKLNKMQQSNAVFYNKLCEAKNYPNEITPKTETCKYCF